MVSLWPSGIHLFLFKPSLPVNYAFTGNCVSARGNPDDDPIKTLKRLNFSLHHNAAEVMLASCM